MPKVANASPITFYVQPKVVETNAVITVDVSFVEYEAAHPIVVAEEMERPAPETKAVLRDFKGQKPDDYGAIKSRGTDTFQLRVHPSSKDRVLGLVDALAKACRNRGFTFQVRISVQ